VATTALSGHAASMTKQEAQLPQRDSARQLHTRLLQFRAEVNRQETIESWGYPTVKTPWWYSLSRFDMIPDCDRQTDGRTDRRNLSQLIQRSAQQAMLTRCKKSRSHLWRYNSWLLSLQRLSWFCWLGDRKSIRPVKKSCSNNSKNILWGNLVHNWEQPTLDKVAAAVKQKL